MIVFGNKKQLIYLPTLLVASDLRAFKLLHKIWESTVSENKRKALMLPIALTRQEAAFQFLFDTIKTGPETYAKAALEACRVYDYDEDFQTRVQEAVEARGFKKGRSK